MAVEYSTDYILDDKVKVTQLTSGFRVGIDAVLLAATVKGSPALTRALDVGCGVGGVSLCLAHRLQQGSNNQAAIHGIDINPEFVKLAKLNAKDNNLDSHLTFTEADLFAPFPEHWQHHFDVVVSNPPYISASHGSSGKEADTKTQAHREQTPESLGEWIKYCITALKHKGWLHVVFPAERLDDLLASLNGKAGNIRIFPLFAYAGEPAKRVLVLAQKGIRSGVKLLPGLILHPGERSKGKSHPGYTPEAERVILGGEFLDI